MFCGLVLGSMAYVFGLARTRMTKDPFMRSTERAFSCGFVCVRVPELSNGSLGGVVFERLTS